MLPSSLRCVLCAAMAMIAHASSSGVDYARSDAFAAKIRSAAAAAEVNVAPRWVPGGEALWYRRNAADGAVEYVFVDIPKAEKRLAFDHARLAGALKAQGLMAREAKALPFTSIDPARDGSVKFRIGAKVLSFAGGVVAPWTGEFREEKLKPLPMEMPSMSGDTTTSVTFVNRKSSPVSIFWLDTDMLPISYGTIDAGATTTIKTYVGHVWRIADPQGKTIATFMATADEAAATIEDNMPKPKVLDPDFAAMGLDAEDAAQMGIEDVDEVTISGPKLGRRQFDFSALMGKRSGKVFVKDFNVFAKDGAGDVQISKDGVKDDAYSARNVYVSPDEKFAVVWQVKPAQQHLVTLIESSPKGQVQPKSRTIPYLKPGDRVAVQRPKIFDLEKKAEVPTTNDLFENPYDVINIGWSRDGSEYRFIFNQRGHGAQRIVGIDRAGKVRAIIEEKYDTFVDYSSKTYRKSIDGTDNMIWASERDGYNHLYMFDMKAGKLVNQITKGPWVMRSVDRVDMAGKVIYFKAFGIVPGQDPYYAHLVRVNFDGTGLQILTEGDGTHTWKWSPDNKTFTDTWSRVDMAPKSVLRDASTGKAVVRLEEGSLTALKAAAWSAPEIFVAPGRDGKTPIHGIIIKPSTFDPAKKYPIIEQIYAGPQDFFCPKAFSTLTRQHELAELGFIVVQLDGMGTNWRSKAFHNVCYKNLKDGGFPDRIAWMKAAASTRPWFDTSRVGVYGGSAGGQNAASAVLNFGDFYKAAAADSGCHDNRMDKIWWNEAWMGTLDESYEQNSNVYHARNLTGHLMLLVGELDTNVDPASTFQVANALNKAMKDYDLIVIPGGGHGSGSGPYGLRRQRDFFVKHLLGVEPPNRNTLSPTRVSGFVVSGNATAGAEGNDVDEFRERVPAWMQKLTAYRGAGTLVDFLEAQRSL